MDCVDLFSAVSSPCGGRSHWCLFSLPRTRGANLARRSVYICPKNYPIKREFGMWFHADHLLLKSCSNTIKPLGNNWTNTLELVMDTHLPNTVVRLLEITSLLWLWHFSPMAHMLHLILLLEHPFENYDLDYNLDNWPRCGLLSWVNSCLL